jgi:Leucine rich repeat
VLKKVLLSIIVLTSLVVVPQPADAQTTEPPSDLDSLSIDSDQRTDRVGLVDPATGIWNLRNAGGTVTSFFYGDPGDYPFAGDWNCDGIDTPGLYRQSDGFVYLRDSNTQGVANIRFFFGNPGDIPLAGDFDNDGCDTVSIYRPSESRIYVINELGSNDGGLGAAEFNYIFGNPGDKPFVGDFNGDGTDTVGLHRESTGFVYFRQTHTQGIADSEFFFGDPGDRLVAGDWGVLDGIDTPAVFRPANSTFYFRHTNTQGIADQSLVFGSSTFLPVAGRWRQSDAPAPPTISGPLPPALTSFAYSATLTRTGGVTPIVVEKISGPAWLKVSSAGVVSGTAPATAGPVDLGVRITDRRGLTDTATVRIQVVTGCQGNIPTNLTTAQCNALINLFKATGGYGWVDMEGWLTGDPCEWHGITCASPNVAAIELDANNLRGSLPNLSAFTALTTFDVGENAIGGGLGNVNTLPVVQELELSENRFSGSIPGGLFQKTSLTQVDLTTNNLTGGIPTTINMPALQLLGLGNNGLTGSIPPQIGNLTAVTELDFGDNRLGGTLPEALEELPALTVLQLHGNLCFAPGTVSTTFLFNHDPEWNDGCV